jgi:hypothetical protein
MSITKAAATVVGGKLSLGTVTTPSHSNYTSLDSLINAAKMVPTDADSNEGLYARALWLMIPWARSKDYCTHKYAYVPFDDEEDNYVMVINYDLGRIGITIGPTYSLGPMLHGEKTFRLDSVGILHCHHLPYHTKVY